MGHYLQTACTRCGHDIEGPARGGDWRDRGNGTECLPYRVTRTGEVERPKGRHTNRPLQHGRVV